MYSIYGFTFPPGPYDPLAGGSWPVTYGAPGAPGAECFFAVEGLIDQDPEYIKGVISPIKLAVEGLMFGSIGTEGLIDQDPEYIRGRIDNTTTATRGVMCQ